MEYERPEWKVGNENRAPTAEQAEAMDDPQALAVAKRMQVRMEKTRRSDVFFRFSELSHDDVASTARSIPDWKMQPYIDRLVTVGVLRRKSTVGGAGYYYLPTDHTWPWIQVVLADHKDT